MSAAIELDRYAEALGGDDDFFKGRAFAKYWTPIFAQHGDFTLGIKGEAAFVGDDAPFFEFPYIEMRGLRAMRYQGDRIAQGELELSWGITPRWSLVVFGGVGQAFNSDDDEDSSGAVFAEGFGFRYLIARRFGLKAGIDVAHGPEENAIYFQVGNAWAR